MCASVGRHCLVRWVLLVSAEGLVWQWMRRCQNHTQTQCTSTRVEVVGLCIDSIPSPPVKALIISDASNAAAAALLDEPPQIGNRSPGIWSVCFQGGTFDRVKQRCRLIAACHTYIDHIICLLCIVHLYNQLNHCTCTMSRSDVPQVFG